jgi:integrase
MHRLTAAEVRCGGAGKYCDGAGLWLVKTGQSSGKWVLRVTIHGRRREMGLGSIEAVTLKQARELAARWRSETVAGNDPIKLRRALARTESRSDTSLGTIAEAAFEARKAELKGDGKAGRWMSPLELHVLPRMGRMPVEEIDQRDIRDVLAPIWHEKADTARKAANRLNLILKHAAAMGLAVDLQAVEKARALLGKSRHRPSHIGSMGWQEVPAFYASIDEPTVTHLALRFLILTGLRSRPVRFLRLDRISGEVLTVPGEEMKGLRDRTPDFRVPLSSEALRVIDLARPFERDGFLFPSERKGVISDATMSRLMERRGLEARPHGFRAGLRNWVSETTDVPFEVAEALLGHKVGSAVTRAYLRTDFLEERRSILERWGGFVSGAST